MLGPALLGGWIGGSLLGALALWNGLGWLAALAAYSLGGSLLVLAFALLPLLEFRLPQPACRALPTSASAGGSDARRRPSRDGAGTRHALLVTLGPTRQR